jgi:hypothetical protein
MWKIFFNSEESFLTVLQALEKWKAEIFNNMQNEIKQYFAKKVVVYFDHMMMFNQKKGIHQNLMDALSQGEKEMQSLDSIFNPVKIYLVNEENGVGLITLNLDDKYLYSLEEYGFILVKNNAKLNDVKEIRLNNMSWGTLVFDLELVNYASGWIDWTPSLEERSKLQAQYIIVSMYCKKETSLLDKVKFEENIENHPQYEELYNKVYRVMPKVENSLEDEWKIAIETKQIEDGFGKIKKNKSIK